MNFLHHTQFPRLSRGGAAALAGIAATAVIALTGPDKMPVTQAAQSDARGLQGIRGIAGSLGPQHATDRQPTRGLLGIEGINGPGHDR